MTTIEVEDVSDVRKKVTFEVPSEKVQEVIDAEYKDLKKNIQIKGFRKGKVPIDILRARFKENVEADVSRRIIEETFAKGLEENNIEPVSIIKIEPEAIATEQPFKFTAEIEVPPPIDVKDYKGLELTKHIREVDEAKVNEELESIREGNAHMRPLSEGQEVKQGDHMVVDVAAEADGSKITDLCVDDYHLELGRDFYLPGFDERLIGMKVGETRNITIELPEDFAFSELAGEEASFEVNLVEAKERILPELDDDLAKDVGEFETLDELKQDIRKRQEESLEERSRNELEEQIVNKLIEANPVEVPEALIESRIDRMIEDTWGRIASLGIDPRDLGLDEPSQRENLRPAAMRMVQAGLLLKAVADKEGIEVSDEDLEAAFEKEATERDLSVDHFRDTIEELGVLGDFKGRLLQEKVLDMVKEHAHITEEAAPPEEGAPEDESTEEVEKD